MTTAAAPAQPRAADQTPDKSSDKPATPPTEPTAAEKLAALVGAPPAADPARAGARRFHVAQNVSGALRKKEFFLEHQRLGHNVVPIGEPCEGFSFETGCPGHRIDDEGQGEAAPRSEAAK